MNGEVLIAVPFIFLFCCAYIFFCIWVNLLQCMYHDGSFYVMSMSYFVLRWIWSGKHRWHWCDLWRVSYWGRVIWGHTEFISCRIHDCSFAWSFSDQSRISFTWIPSVSQIVVDASMFQ